ncbi:hypothetical protein D3C72_1226370 [compost metagenome]
MLYLDATYFPIKTVIPNIHQPIVSIIKNIFLECIYPYDLVTTNVAPDIDNRVIVLHITVRAIKKCNSGSFFDTRQRKGSHLIVFAPKPLLILTLQINGSLKRSRESTNKGLSQIVALIGNHTSIIVRLDVLENITLLDKIDRDEIGISLGCRLALIINSI